MSQSSPQSVLVIGAGLAGTEAAWQIARAGIPVRLVEMRPVRRSPAHHSSEFAELVCGPDHEGAEAAQFLLQQASGPITAEGAKAIAADQLGEFAAVVGRGAAHRPHFHQAHGNAGSGDLPGGLGTGQACPDHQDGLGAGLRHAKTGPA